MNTSNTIDRVRLVVLISLVIFVAYSTPAIGHFAITYYDNYNYNEALWSAWQTSATPLDAWDNKYLATESSGKTVFTDHAFESIDVFDLRGDLWSKDGHATSGEDWNPLQSIGDDASEQSAHHVFAALFQGLVYLEEGDVLSVESDDDVYIFLDGNTAWGQEILSHPGIHYFGNVSTTITLAQEGYHTMTVKFIERRNTHSGIQINLNDFPLVAAEGVGTPGYWKSHPEAWPMDSIVISDYQYSKDETIFFMDQPKRKDMTYVMFNGLVAAKLNVAIGCLDTCIADVIIEADEWMAENPVGSGVNAKSASWKTVGEGLSEMLDAYNNGELCVPARL